MAEQQKRGSRRLSLRPRGGDKGATGRGGAGRRPAARTAGAAKDRAPAKVGRRERFRQVGTAFTMTRRADPRLVPLMAAAFLLPFVLLLVVGLVFGHAVLLGLFGLLIGLIAATAVFGRRVQRNALSQVEGQVGAAAAVLNNMRGDWRVTPAVGFSREQDLVHRVVGRPGIILVGEGTPGRARGLVVNEKKRLARFVGDVPVYDVLVGDGDGQVPLRGLEKHVVRLPRNIKPREVNLLDRKLKAMVPAAPVPKGPIPSGGRMPRGARPR